MSEHDRFDLFFPKKKSLVQEVAERTGAAAQVREKFAHYHEVMAASICREDCGCLKYCELDFNQ